MKRTILISILATACISAFAADYYVVVPLTGKQALLNGISVALNSTSLPTGLVGVPYAVFDLAQALQVTGDPAYTSANVGWSVVAGVLPAGLTLANGIISGTPTAAGEQTFSVRATYKTKTGEQAYKILTFAVTVALASGTLPQGVIGVAYPSYDLKPLLTVQGDPGFNPANVTWAVVSNTLPVGLTLKADGTISGTPTSSGTGTLVARASYRGVKGEQTYHVVTLAITVGLTGATLPAGVQGAAYSYDLKPQLTVSGDAGYTGSGVTWAVDSGTLPTGLSLNASTGLITGTPTVEGTSSFTARATYRTKTGEQAYQVVVGAITVSLSSATLPDAVLGMSYSYDFKPRLAVSGDAGYNVANVVWSVASGALPAGVTLNTSTGLLAGAPTAVGTQAFSAQAVYKGKVAQQAYLLAARLKGLVLTGSYRTWEDGTVASSCKSYKNPSMPYGYAGSTGNGVYRIQPPSMAAMDVYCDMTTDGGGWTLAAWSNGNPGLANMPAYFLVSDVNPGNIANKAATNAASSINVEAVSKALGTSDVMLVAGSYSASPIIENGNGVWSYDSPDCSGALGHTGRTAGCSNHGGNDNYDSYDSYNIAIYPDNMAIVPYYVNSGRELCWSGRGWCSFEVYLR